MDAYQISFAGLIASNVVLGAWQYRRQNKSTNREIDSEKDGAISEKKTDERAISHFRWEFMPVYLLVVGADWLQVQQPNNIKLWMLTIKAGTIHLYAIQRREAT